MKTSELSDYRLDFWCGKSLGKNVKIIKHQREDSYFCVEATHLLDSDYGRLPKNDGSLHECIKRWNPSANWDIVGQLIDDKKIDTTYGLYTASLPKEVDIWVAMKDGVKYDAFGETPLIAVCRLIVWIEYGDYVPDEGEKEWQNTE